MSDDQTPFAGRRAVLATMHGKERAVAPALRPLGLDLLVPDAIDTDALGTFTREVPRAGTMEDAAIAKARLGMELTGCSIGIASEGSYGPHPQLWVVPGGLELLVLVDDERGIVVKESLVDDHPRFASVEVGPGDDLGAFLERVDFPTHALAVGPVGAAVDDPRHKGIDTVEALHDAIRAAAARSGEGRALLETDMRAHHNPTRMATIGRLAERLAARLRARCPKCASPGFGVVGVEKGLPCEWCGGPSTMVSHEVFGCCACPHRDPRPRSDGLRRAPPHRCTLCNP